MNKNPLTQKVNFFISVIFIALFGLFMTLKIINVESVAHTEGPIRNAAAATRTALQN